MIIDIIYDPNDLFSFQSSSICFFIILVVVVVVAVFTVLYWHGWLVRGVIGGVMGMTRETR